MTSVNLGKTNVHNKVQNVWLPSSTLTKHVAVFGASGSGKTGAILSLVEECIRTKVPTILVDIKGDMANIAQQDLSNINLRIITPGATHGEPINIFHGLSKTERIMNSVTSILKMVGERKSGDPVKDRMHAFLSQILHHMHKTNMPTDLETIVNMIMEPPFTSFGALELDLAIPRKSRGALAAKINTLFVAPSMQLWREGSGLNIDELYNNQYDDKTNVTVYSVAHIVNEEQRQFAISILLDEVYGWMKAQSGCEDLRAGLVIDECVGILPPHPANPPTKGPLMTLLKQARAFGLGIVLSSQNTVDLDYKALSNCETWLVGKLSMKRDRDRLIEAILAQTRHSSDTINSRIAGLEPRKFLIVRPRMVWTYTTHDTQCNLTGPLTAYELSKYQTR